jgi:hypothetical protein
MPTVTSWQFACSRQQLGYHANTDGLKVTTVTTSMNLQGVVKKSVGNCCWQVSFSANVHQQKKLSHCSPLRTINRLSTIIEGCNVHAYCTWRLANAFIIETLPCDRLYRFVAMIPQEIRRRLIGRKENRPLAAA